MLQLKNITKNYFVGDITVPALGGVSISFRKSEFVSILGPSGCGKTTLLNIIGGLDRYTDGDIVINGTSTKDYKDKDWDSYRNHSIGFVFQSYNLIPHQSVLKNVELALTLSGIKREERRERARLALEKVGLGDQLSKKPNQMSGGQMQRVAIARAIVNDPDIILADEPTGALDTETSVQVMEILKELSKTKLVIMVTHNPELATQYSTRIINLKDGVILDDSMPYSCEDEKPNDAERKAKKPSMSFWTALSLSFNNLFTKKARTILTAFAGSIGIIGIALILSLSSGFNNYIKDVQRDTLSNYPITINETNIDTTSLMTTLMGTTERDTEKFPNDDSITCNNAINDMLTNIIAGISKNDLTAFKKYLDENVDKDMVSAIKYSYNLNTQIYVKDSLKDDAYRVVSPLTLPPVSEIMSDQLADAIGNYYYQFQSYMTQSPVFTEMIDNDDLIKEQYDIFGSMPDKDNPNEALIVVDQYNQIDDITLYALGLMTDKDIEYIFADIAANIARKQLPLMYPELTNEQIEAMIQTPEEMGLTRSKMNYTFDELKALEFDIMLPGEAYKANGEADKTPNGLNTYSKLSDSEIFEFIKSDKAEKLNICGIARLKENVSSGALSGTVCYRKELTEKLIENNNKLEIIQNHKSLLNADGTTKDKLYNLIPLTIDDNTIPVGTEIEMSQYDIITAKLGVVDIESPSMISIYPTSFENKDYITNFIDDYNNADGRVEAEKIKYTDYIGLLLSSVTIIINAITYVLIAFVSISLVVSSIMIGIITYISVLERTKEIGILRSIGASKRDVKRVFNAETIIIGFVAGTMGILITLILNIPINLIINSVAKLGNIAVLPPLGAIILIAISVLLTTIAGLFPASIASKKDPVVALRTE